jgi:glycine transporter
MVGVSFQLPVEFDLVAVFLFALTGVWAATKRGYDVVGAFVLAFVTGVGGGLLRDGIFLCGRGGDRRLCRLRRQQIADRRRLARSRGAGRAVQCGGRRPDPRRDRARGAAADEARAALLPRHPGRLRGLRADEPSLRLGGADVGLRR